MARIPYFDLALTTDRAAKAAVRLPPLNIFRMMGHAGDLLDGFTRFGGQILNLMSLDPGLREIAIVRVGVLSGATYEVFQHERIARDVGLSAQVIAAIRDGPEAKSAGFDVKVLRQLIRVRKQEAAEVEEQARTA